MSGTTSPLTSSLRSDISASDWAEPEQAGIDDVEVSSDDCPDDFDSDTTEEDML